MLRTLQLAYRIKQRRPKQQQANRSATLAVSRLSHFGRFRGYRTLGGFAAIALWAVSRLSHLGRFRGYRTFMMWSNVL